MHIRTATKEDKEEILNLVKKLAEYERKKPEEVQLTIDKIDSHGFGSHFNILIAEYNKKPIGYALYFFSYSASLGAPILYLEDLFVENEYRLQGLGQALLSRLANIAIENECCRMEWHSFTWNEKAISFYKSLGAIPKPDLLQFRLGGEDLKKLSTEENKLDSRELVSGSEL